jgi:NAD(P)-dependent dehydrogenase (short-subunit alcohol dehydrogenase family)
MSDLGLKDRVILVTGAARGLGLAYALALAKAGAAVAMNDAGVDKEGHNPDPAPLEQAARGLSDQGFDVLAVNHLLAGLASGRELIARVLQWKGRLDGLVHNAGQVPILDPCDVDEAVYQGYMGVAADAAFGLAAGALEVMRRQHYGRIVLTSSGWALLPSPGSGELALYALGKAAQVGLALALAEGGGHPDIKTNVIVPVAKTRIFRAEVPEGRLRPEMVAGAVAWLASPACTVNGRLVEARDGRIALFSVLRGETRELGEAAADPRSTGEAIAALAQAHA